MNIEYNGISYDNRHGGPFDRGAADNYYGRLFRPHYFAGGTYQSEEIIPAKGTVEYNEYCAGYDFNEESGDKKDWG